MMASDHQIAVRALKGPTVLPELFDGLLCSESRGHRYSRFTMNCTIHEVIW